MENYIPKPGWIKKQTSFAASETKKWPDWMKQEARIHEYDKNNKLKGDKKMVETQEEKDQRLVGKSFIAMTSFSDYCIRMSNGEVTLEVVDGALKSLQEFRDVLEESLEE